MVWCGVVQCFRIYSPVVCVLLKADLTNNRRGMELSTSCRTFSQQPAISSHLLAFLFFAISTVIIPTDLLIQLLLK